jgi:hypothetical protein
MGMGRRQKAVEYPKAFACAMLEDGGRVLFLMGKEAHGKSRLVLPYAEIRGRRDPVAEIGNAFLEQSGIDGQVHEIIFEGRYNAGSRKYKRWIPLLVFRVGAKRMQARPSPGFVGFKWLSPKGALEREKKKELLLEKWVSALLREIVRP